MTMNITETPGIPESKGSTTAGILGLAYLLLGGTGLAANGLTVGSFIKFKEFHSAPYYWMTALAVNNCNMMLVIGLYAGVRVMTGWTGGFIVECVIITADHVDNGMDENRPLDTPPPPSGEDMDEDFVLGTGMPAPDAAPGIEMDPPAPSPNPGPDNYSGAQAIKLEPADIGATAIPTNIEELDAAAALKELNVAIALASDGAPALVASVSTDFIAPSADPCAPSPTVRQMLKDAESLVLHLRRLLEQSQAEAGLLRAEAARNAEKLAEIDQMADAVTEAHTELNELRVQAIVCRDHHKPEGGLILEKVQQERADNKTENRHIRRRVQYLEKQVHRLTVALKMKERAYDATRGQYKSILLVNEKLRRRVAEASKQPAGKLSRRQRAIRVQEAREKEAQERLADVPMDERALVIVEEPVEPATSAGPGTSAEAVPLATSAPAPETPNPNPVPGYTIRAQARAEACKARRAARAAASSPIAVVAPYCPVVTGKEANAACRALLPKKAMWRVETGKLLPRAPQLLTAGNSVPLGSAPFKGPSGSQHMQQDNQQPSQPVSQPPRHSRDASNHSRRSRESSHSQGTYEARRHQQQHRHHHRRSRSPSAWHSKHHHHPGNCQC